MLRSSCAQRLDTLTLAWNGLMARWGKFACGLGLFRQRRRPIRHAALAPSRMDERSAPSETLVALLTGIGVAGLAAWVGSVVAGDASVAEGDAVLVDDATTVANAASQSPDAVFFRIENVPGEAPSEAVLDWLGDWSAGEGDEFLGGVDLDRPAAAPAADASDMTSPPRRACPAALA